MHEPSVIFTWTAFVNKHGNGAKTEVFEYFQLTWIQKKRDQGLQKYTFKMNGCYKNNYLTEHYKH